MIISRLIGGLGNQMFQYAIGRSLAYANKSELKLDLSGYKTYTLHKYSLKNFSIIEDFGDKKDFETRFPTFLWKIFFSPPDSNYKYIKEKKEFYYDPMILDLKGNIYLDGYWQTDKFFKDISDLIRNDFTVRTEPDEKNRALLDKIEDCNSVALHIRRGDYVTNSIAHSYHGTCDLGYYTECIDIIAQRIDSPHFFLFSDDPKWVKSNLPMKFPSAVIAHNGAEKNYEDMRLMSGCKHFIIANSSFSWWGAWLSRNPNKSVLAPKRWFKANIDTMDLLPKEWERV